MSVISNVILIVLFIINLLATLYSGVVVATIYDEVCSDELISSAYAIVYGIIRLLTIKLTEYNINLTVLLTVVAIIANILVARLAIKIDYKRNTKPYLRIKF